MFHVWAKQTGIILGGLLVRRILPPPVLPQGLKRMMHGLSFDFSGHNQTQSF
ncbi:hypothetical protein FC82_GL001690 [Secundilactobacillus collinoides DSM 20515 = JCM 1123]|uniref:Uncharacterized protein n=1 Tax=Secundilactobacillus collinoides DSM 20515 = JCM 1123 TaxID=1423733 RepID=A0A0R2BBB2_SECCO|nr:hypothetical protein FC82_GL001690 [Secundilactobacillus collinoides DSM 20515 = JCM 1123]